MLPYMIFKLMEVVAMTIVAFFLQGWLMKRYPGVQTFVAV